MLNFTYCLLPICHILLCQYKASVLLRFSQKDLWMQGITVLKTYYAQGLFIISSIRGIVGMIFNRKPGSLTKGEDRQINYVCLKARSHFKHLLHLLHSTMELNSDLEAMSLESSLNPSESQQSAIDSLPEDNLNAPCPFKPACLAKVCTLLSHRTFHLTLV